MGYNACYPPGIRRARPVRRPTSRLDMLRRPRQSIQLALVLTGALSATPYAQKTVTIATHGDAFVQRDSTSTWIIGNSRVRLQLGFGASGSLSIQRLWDPNS